MIGSPTRRLAALLFLALSVTACGDFTRANPFDPGVRVKLAISGPDSAFSVGERLQFSLNTTPPFAHEPPTWWLSDTHGTMEAEIDQSGIFTVKLERPFGSMLGATQDVTVHVRLGGDRVAQKKVIFIHRPVRLCLLNCDPNKTVRLDSIRPDVEAPIAYVDARGNFIAPSPSMTIVTRMSGVVDLVLTSNSSGGLQYYRISRKALGSTWVVATAGGFADSLFVTVTDTVPWRYRY